MLLQVSPSRKGLREAFFPDDRVRRRGRHAYAVKREGTGAVGHQLQSSTFASQVLPQMIHLL
jgi:hypothetical protein